MVLVEEVLPVAGNQNKWVHSFLTPEQIEEISQLVQEMEKKTSGEIVPIIVRRSSAIRYIPGVITSLLLIIFFALQIFNLIATGFAFYFSNIFAILGPYILLFFIAAFFYFCSLFLTRFKWVQRLFVPDLDKLESVQQRAYNEFYLNHVAKTSQRTGIMIFISLMEQQTIVMADEAISKKLPPNTWQEIVDIIVNAVKSKNTANGLKDAIKMCGQILSEHFPIQPGDKNELSNKLIIKD